MTIEKIMDKARKAVRDSWTGDTSHAYRRAFEVTSSHYENIDIAAGMAWYAVKDIKFERLDKGL